MKFFIQRSDIGALVKELTDRMDKTKSERAQLQENIDSMELELRQVQEEIAEVTRQNEHVSGTYSNKKFKNRENLLLLCTNSLLIL